MGLMDFIKKQFVDVIQWTEEADGVLAYRFPMQDLEIQQGAQLTVRESQLALFVDEGKVADLFGPGRHTLKTQTLPLLTNLRHWDKLFESPFKSDVYFFSTRLQLDRKWGTPNPITIRDQEFGLVRMRAFGIYSYRLADPRRFYLEVSGTRETYTVDDLEGQLRNTLVGSMTDLFAESAIRFADMAANQEELGHQLKAKMEPLFQRYGLALDSLAVQNVSLPEELQQVLDQRIGMGLVGDMGRFTRYQVAQSIPVAAGNEGGLAGAGTGLGAGAAMGQAFAQALGQTAAQAPAAGGAAPSSGELMATLEKLHALMTKGVITQQEFEAKKAELLNKLG